MSSSSADTSNWRAPAFRFKAPCAQRFCELTFEQGRFVLFSDENEIRRQDQEGLSILQMLLDRAAANPKQPTIDEQHLAKSRLVPMNDLLEAAWPKARSQNAQANRPARLHTQIGKLRRTLGDSDGSLIVNEPGCGYYFWGDVEILTGLGTPLGNRPRPPDDKSGLPAAITTASPKYAALYASQLNEHWKPRAMGSGALPLGHWYFTGRTNALGDLVTWLAADESDGKTRVVTGDPGAGKSAILGLLVTATDAAELRDPKLIALLRKMPERARPNHKSIDCALNLEGRTLQSTLGELASCFHCEPNQVVDVLSKRSMKTTIVFDSLDEATVPSDIAYNLIRQLSGYSHLRIIIGARRPELNILPRSCTILDLDEPQYRETNDIARYVERLLSAPDDHRRIAPYRQAPLLTTEAAKAIEIAATGNFLIAYIIAMELREWSVGEGRPIDVKHEALPRTAAEAFDNYTRRLGDRSGIGYVALRRAFTWLAYAEGQGFSRAAWSRVIKEDIDTIRHVAAAFIPERHEDGYRSYRLFHRTLAESLRDGNRDREAQSFITEALINGVPHGDFIHADPYTRKYLPRHAASAGRLNELLLNTRFLAAADPEVLLSSLTGADISHEAKRREHWYRLTADRLELTSDPTERLCYLDFVARQHGARDLSISTDGIASKPWRTRWAHRPDDIPHRKLVGQEDEILAVAIYGAIVASATAGAIVAWNCYTGTRRFDPIRRETDWTFDNIHVNEAGIVTSSTDHVIRLWHPETGGLMGYWPMEPGSCKPAFYRMMFVTASPQGTLRVKQIERSQATDSQYWVAEEVGACEIGPYQQRWSLALNDNIVAAIRDYDVYFWRYRDNVKKAVPVDGCLPEVRSIAMDNAVLLISDMAGLHAFNFEGRDIFYGRREAEIVKCAVSDQFAVDSWLDGIFCHDRTTDATVQLLGRTSGSNVANVAIAGSFIVAGHESGHVQLWNLGDMTNRMSLSTPAAPVNLQLYRDNPIAVSSSVVVTATYGNILFWDAATGHQLQSGIKFPHTMYRARGLWIGSNAITFCGMLDTEDRNRAIGVFSVRLPVDGAGQDQPLVLLYPPVIIGDFLQGVVAIGNDLAAASTPSGEVVLTRLNREVGAKEIVHHWDLGHLDDAVGGVALCDNALASCGKDGTIFVWDITTQEKVNSFRLHCSHDFDGTLALTADRIATHYRDRVFVWDRHTNALILSLCVGDMVTALAMRRSTLYVVAANAVACIAF